VEPELLAEFEGSLTELVSEPEDSSVLKEAEFNESEEPEDESEDSEEPDAKEAEESHGVCVCVVVSVIGAAVVLVAVATADKNARARAKFIFLHAMSTLACPTFERSWRRLDTQALTWRAKR